MKDTLILAIESSCDETAASVVKNGRTILSNVISSQIALHTLYGGVLDVHPVGNSVLGALLALDGTGLVDGSAVQQQLFGHPSGQHPNLVFMLLSHNFVLLCTKPGRPTARLYPSFIREPREAIGAGTPRPTNAKNGLQPGRQLFFPVPEHQL